MCIIPGVCNGNNWRVELRLLARMLADRPHLLTPGNAVDACSRGREDDIDFLRGFSLVPDILPSFAKDTLPNVRVSWHFLGGDIRGGTLLHVACRSPRVSRALVQTLLDIGVNPGTRTYPDGATCLHLLLENKYFPNEYAQMSLLNELGAAIGPLILLSSVSMASHATRYVLENSITVDENHAFIRSIADVSPKERSELALLADRYSRPDVRRLLLPDEDA